MEFENPSNSYIRRKDDVPIIPHFVERGVGRNPSAGPPKNE